MQSVVIIDYGASNLRSVANALETVARDLTRGVCKIRISADFAIIRGADRLVFPGQGAMGQCMHALLSQGYRELLHECIHSKPFLGICLGLQSLLDFSEEDGGVAGLGILPGRVQRFPDKPCNTRGTAYKIPHMGWNEVQQNTAHPLWQGIDNKARFYFVHSYYAAPKRQEDITGTTTYIIEFAAAAAKDNLFATQFHPEKSQRAGLRLLANFLRWQP